MYNDDCMLKLDANIEIPTTVRNHFEDDLNCEMFYNNYSYSEYSQAGTSRSSNEAGNNTSFDSDGTSTISDASTIIGDSMIIDAPAIVDAPVVEVKYPEETAPTEANGYLRNKNVKERIVFCIDMSTDMEKTPFTTKNAKLSPLSMIKRVIGMYFQNKKFIDKKHEYSLMILYETATWVCDFSGNTRNLVKSLEALSETLECNSCDLSSVISLLLEKYPFLLSTNPTDVLCIYRVILIYARSNCKIHFSDPAVKNIILASPSFILDVLYIHEPESENNNSLGIYEFFCNLDVHDKAYIFEMTRSVTSLHNFMGKLLSHPFQRAAQKNTNYRLRHLVPRDTSDT